MVILNQWKWANADWVNITVSTMMKWPEEEKKEIKVKRQNKYQLQNESHQINRVQSVSGIGFIACMLENSYKFCLWSHHIWIIKSPSTYELKKIYIVTFSL